MLVVAASDSTRGGHASTHSPQPLHSSAFSTSPPRSTPFISRGVGRREMKGVDRGGLVLNADECKGCGLCVEACPPRVLSLAATTNIHGYHTATYAGTGCPGCGICYFVCPEPDGITVLRAAA